MSNSIFEVTIPDYIRKVRLSNSRRTLYYSWDGIDIRAKKTAQSKGKQIPKKYLNWTDDNDVIKPNQIKGYLGIKTTSNKFKGFISAKEWVDNNLESFVKLKLYCVEQYNLTLNQQKALKFIICDENKEPIIANPKIAGTPKNYVINGQDFYSGNLREHTRAKVIQQIKESFVPYLKNLSKVEEPNFPNTYTITLEIHDTIKNKYDKSKDKIGTGWDIGNRGYLPYLKTFVDLLVTGKTNSNTKVIEPILPEDHRLIISGEKVLFCPINEKDTPKLIFKLRKRKFNYE